MSALPQIAIEKHYTVSQVAELWSISEATVRRIFEDMPGVLKIAMPRLMRGRKQRARVKLSIPLSLVEVAHQQWAGRPGPKIQGGSGGI